MPVVLKFVYAAESPSIVNKFWCPGHTLTTSIRVSKSRTKALVLSEAPRVIPMGITNWGPLINVVLILYFNKACKLIKSPHPTFLYLVLVLLNLNLDKKSQDTFIILCAYAVLL